MNNIIRGTTPTLKFTYDNVDLSMLSAAYLTIRQFNNTIEKTLEDGEVGENYIQWKLTQEETLQLTNTDKVEIQCRFKLSDGTVGASQAYKIEVSRILKDGAI